MKVTDSEHTFGEAETHHWFYTGEGWIRLTDQQLLNAKEFAVKNRKDTPELSLFKKCIISLFL